MARDGTDSLEVATYVSRERMPFSRLLRATTPRERRELVEALVPFVGAALRGAVATSIKRRFVLLNRFFVHNLSAQGLRWRFEALHTGRRFSEIVLKNSLLHPVSQVFLIHRRTGLLLFQAQNVADETQDGDMVSGMLTAIQDFVHDSFKVPNHEHLDTIQIGEVTVLVESGPEAILAGILRGDAPPRLRETFRMALHDVHAEFGDALRAFAGNAEVFGGAHRLIEPCLSLQFVKGDERISPMTVLTLIGPVLAMLVWSGLAMHQHWRWHGYIQRVQDTPGLIVVRSGWRSGRPYVDGLRDPLAPDPEGLLLEAGFAPRDVDGHWTPYLAMHGDAVLAAARRILAPPAGVTLDVRDGVLHASGEATPAWLASARTLAPAVPGVLRGRFDAVRVLDVALTREWRDFTTRLGVEPGIWVIEEGEWNGRFHVRGLRDPLARDPGEIMRECGLESALVTARWEPYESLAPAFVLARVRQALDPPSTVTLRADGTTIVAKGEATHGWITRARLLGGALPGASLLNLDAVVDIDRRVVDAAVPGVESHVFLFLADGQNLWPGQENELQAFIGKARELARAAMRLNADYTIEVHGYAKPSGEADVDRAASESVAQRMFDILTQRRLSVDRLVVKGMGPLPPAMSARRREHQVGFRVEILERM